MNRNRVTPALALPVGLKIVAFALAAAINTAGASAAPRAIGTLERGMSPRISRCLISREPELVRSWLATLPGSREEDRLVRRAEPRFIACFGDMNGGAGSSWLPAYDRIAMRAALVRALLQTRRGRLASTLPPGGEPVWPAGLAGVEGAEAETDTVAAAELGACLARKHWSHVVALIGAVDPETEKLDFVVRWRWEAARKREAAAAAAALARIIPSIGGCVPAGTRLRIDRRRLRSLVEEAAYHLTDVEPAAVGDERRE